MAEKVTQALIYQELQYIKRDVSEIKAAVNGTDQTPGLKIRVDRIEQTEGRRRRMFGYVWASIGSLLVGLVLLAVPSCKITSQAPNLHARPLPSPSLLETPRSAS